MGYGRWGMRDALKQFYTNSTTNYFILSLEMLSYNTKTTWITNPPFLSRTDGTWNSSNNGGLIFFSDNNTTSFFNPDPSTTNSISGYSSTKSIGSTGYGGTMATGLLDGNNSNGFVFWTYRIKLTIPGQVTKIYFKTESTFTTNNPTGISIGSDVTAVTSSSVVSNTSRTNNIGYITNEFYKAYTDLSYTSGVANITLTTNIPDTVDYIYVTIFKNKQYQGYQSEIYLQV